MLWMACPTGMLMSGSALPGRMAADGPDRTASPTSSAAGARMYENADPSSPAMSAQNVIIMFSHKECASWLRQGFQG